MLSITFYFLWCLYDRKLPVCFQFHALNPSGFISEVDDYISEPCIEMSENPLMYWQIKLHLITITFSITPTLSTVQSETKHDKSL
jgi:hypothetical protein